MAEENNRLKSFVIGVAGGMAGLLAMRAYWQKAAPWVQDTVNLGGTEAYPESADLDDIAQVDRQYKEDESATDALGRMAYQAVTGREPETEEKKKQLSELVHWVYGMLQGGLYGIWRSGSRLPSLKSGALFSAGLWLLGDEVTVPMLGLQSGPTAVAPKSHINRLGAHLAYGITTSLVSRVLHKLL